MESQGKTGVIHRNVDQDSLHLELPLLPPEAGDIFDPSSSSVAIPSPPCEVGKASLRRISTTQAPPCGAGGRHTTRGIAKIMAEEQAGKDGSTKDSQRGVLGIRPQGEKQDVHAVKRVILPERPQPEQANLTWAGALSVRLVEGSSSRSNTRNRSKRNCNRNSIRSIIVELLYILRVCIYSTTLIFMWQANAGE